MTQSQIEARAASFAHRVKNISRFVVVEPEAKALYGVTNLVVDTKSLRAYYERHEAITEWRDWATFLSVVEQRIERFS